MSDQNQLPLIKNLKQFRIVLSKQKTKKLNIVEIKVIEEMQQCLSVHKVASVIWKAIAWFDCVQERQRSREIETQNYLEGGKKLLGHMAITR